ncbi:Anthranilate phosphoribosyltransferase [hydrothermal vent metagenome]|uniref:anthranilate phosphoribosyltransferase n=1 Tax=hydrothermal vent metagenome TaxID=652676 RepID=A0A3B0SWT9_9ZZZZ
MVDFKAHIAKVAGGEALTRDEAAAAFDILMSGEATPSQIGAFVMALRVRGETVDEIAGAAAAMRAKMTQVAAPNDAIDIVGTGGDASGTYNVSTASALVAAGGGVTVAKHGNRALSSKSGAADVLVALGVNIDISPEKISACIQDAGIGFMFAPAHHAAMKHVGPTRVELGTRTIFNLLGPLCNPAGTKRQVLGVFAPEWVKPLADALAKGGSTHVWVVHGDSGLDEISTPGPTKVAELVGGKVKCFEITPQDAGVPRATMADLKGGDAAHNAAAIRKVLKGEPGPFRDIVLMNAGAGFIVAGKADTLAKGAQMAAKAIDTGAALKTLEALISASNS